MKLVGSHNYLDTDQVRRTNSRKFYSRENNNDFRGMTTNYVCHYTISGRVPVRRQENRGKHVFQVEREHIITATDCVPSPVGALIIFLELWSGRLLRVWCLFHCWYGVVISGVTWKDQRVQTHPDLVAYGAQKVPSFLYFSRHKTNMSKINFTRRTRSL